MEDGTRHTLTHGARSSVRQYATWDEICAHVAAFIASSSSDPFLPRHVIVPSKGHGRALAHHFALTQPYTTAICAGVRFETIRELQRRLSEEFPTAELDGVEWKSATPNLPSDGFCAVLIGAPRSADEVFLGQLASRCSVERLEYSPSALNCPMSIRYSRLTSPYRPANVSAADLAQPSPLLRQVQHELRTGQAGELPRELDSSIQIHASHGPNRQVEVLRDVLCGLFDDDPQLEPRDVLVLCTNLSEYAPLIEAAFSPHIGIRDVSDQRNGESENYRNETDDDNPPDTASFSDDPARAASRHGQLRHHPGRRLRVQVASNALARQDPVLELLLAALRLNTSRGTLSELLDFAAMPPIAALFGFDAVAISRLRELLAAARVSWGMDGGARAHFGLPNIRQGTWLAGIERINASLLLPGRPGDTLGTASPIPGVEVRDAELIGAITELVSRLRKCASTSAPATCTEWAIRLRQWLDDLVGTNTGAGNGNWSLDSANDALAELAQRVACDLNRQTTLSTTDPSLPATLGVSAQSDKLDSADIAAWLKSRRVRRGRPNYFNGNLLVTQLGDLDAIPHKVICVLGLDDKHFPGSAATGSDSQDEQEPMAGSDNPADLEGEVGNATTPPTTTLRNATRTPPRLGEAGDAATIATPTGATQATTTAAPISVADDPRARSRQRLFNAILVAKDTFIVITQGADPRSNESLPPSVCIQDLIEVCRLNTQCSQWPGHDPSLVPDRLVRKHSLQPHSWANFTSELESPPSSFDEDALQGALALQGLDWQLPCGDSLSSSARPADASLPTHPTGAPDTTLNPDTTLDELTAFYLHPARELLKRSAGLSLTRWAVELDENLPVKLGPLQAWQVGQRLLDARLGGAPPQSSELDARLDGLLPPGEIGGAALAQISSSVGRIIDSIPVGLRLTTCPSMVSIDIPTRNGRLIGSVETHAKTVANMQYGRIKPKQLVQLWLSILACAASGQPTFGFASGAKDCIALSSPSAGEAVNIIEELLRLRVGGLTELLPLPPATAHAYTDPTIRDPRQAMSDVWKGREFSDDSGSTGEADESWRFFFPDAGLDQLRSVPTRPDDPLALVEIPRVSRFERLAVWFWKPIWRHIISRQELSEQLSASMSTQSGGKS